MTGDPAQTVQALRDLADAVENGDLPDGMVVVRVAMTHVFTRQRFVEAARRAGATDVERRGSQLIAYRRRGATRLEVHAEARDVYESPPVDVLADQLAEELAAEVTS